jgi:cell division protease FtsH
MKTLFKNFLLILLIFITISGLFSLFFQPVDQLEDISLTQVVEDINQDKVKEITVSGNEIEVIRYDDSKFKSRKETENSLSESLINYGVNQEKLRSIKVDIKDTESDWAWLVPVLFSVVPILVFGIFFWMIFRQAKTGAMQTFDFTKSQAKMFGAGGNPKEKITFEDVAGLKEVKEELKEIVDFLKNPKKFLKMGASIPRGVLLLGPSGVGKTLLARAVAGEANVPFFHTSGSTFVELFVGTGAARVRDLFANAKKHAPCLIFVDELDAVGRMRGAGIGGGHDEREQTLNQLLVEMDGFERDTNVIILAATNRPDILDEALLRPGRFDRRVILDLPDINDREEVLKIHCRRKPLAIGVDLREIAERTPGFSGADLANVVNEAAILAARKNKQQIFQEEFLESIEKVILGPERKSHILSRKEKRIAAYHEAGHALVSTLLSETDPVRKVSIIARGLAAGYTLKMPTEDRQIKSKSEFLAEMTMLLGGYCAEKIKFGQITTGATDDLRKASVLARKLVKEYGMSSLGPLSFGEKEELVFLGREISEQRNYSEKVAAQIDKEVAKFIKSSERQANRILSKNKNLLEKIAKTLIEKEIIEREEFESLIGKKRKRNVKSFKVVKAPKPKGKRKKSIKIEVKSL